MSTSFPTKSVTWNFKTLRPLVVALFHEDWLTERQTNRRADKTKLTVADASVFQIRLINMRGNMGSCKYVCRYQMPEALNYVVPQGITWNSSEDGGSVLNLHGVVYLEHGNIYQLCCNNVRFLVFVCILCLCSYFHIKFVTRQLAGTHSSGISKWIL
jgi:hypothetical protein